MGDGILSLSWNNHHATFCDILKKLRKRERYTDVTLSCEGKFYPLHKFVLSTCSEFFERVFENTPCKHPVIVLSDVKCRELEALLSYMYAGAVNVPQSNLALLIKAAEILQVKGLAVPDTPPASASKQQTSSADCVSDRVSPSPKRRRTEETAVDIRTTPQETTSSDVRTKDKGRQIVPENTEVTIKQEKLPEPVSTVESSLNIVDVYHDADIKEEVVEDIIDDSENELRQLESIDYDAQLAPFKADNSNTGTSNYTEPQFDPGLQIENDVSSGTSEILEWQDGIVEADMSSHEGSSGVGMLQPSSPMLGQQSSHLAQHAINAVEGSVMLKPRRGYNRWTPEERLEIGRACMGMGPNRAARELSKKFNKRLSKSTVQNIHKQYLLMIQRNQMVDTSHTLPSTSPGSSQFSSHR